MTTLTITKAAPPEWLLAFWKEIDDKTFGKGFDSFVKDATCQLGVAEWNGSEQIRENLRAFIDTGFTTPRCQGILVWRIGQNLSRHRHNEAR